MRDSCFQLTGVIARWQGVRKSQSGSWPTDRWLPTLPSGAKELDLGNEVVFEETLAWVACMTKLARQLTPWIRPVSVLISAEWASSDGLTLGAAVRLAQSVCRADFTPAR